MTESNVRNEFDPAIEKKLLGGIFVALLIVGGMVWAAVKNNTRQAESAGWVEHSYEFILQSDAILSSLNAAEALQRTHTVTGDADTKQAATTAFGKVKEHLDIAQQLAFESPAQFQRMNRLAELLQRQIDWNKESIQLRAQSQAAAMRVFTNVQTRSNLLEIAKEISAARAEENQFLQQREQKLQRHTRWTEWILYTGIGVNFVLLALAFVVVRRDLNLRRRATAALKDANENLEAKVKLRTKELADALNELQIENLEQKWGQAALERLVGHHDLIFNAIRDGILVVSRTGKIMSTNTATADLSEREPGKLTGRSIAELILENKTSGVVPWKSHFLYGPIKDGVVAEKISGYLKKPNGTVIPVRISCFPTRDQETLTGAVITIYSGL
jgi:PAS domain S-box-containing protein